MTTPTTRPGRMCRYPSDGLGVHTRIQTDSHGTARARARVRRCPSCRNERRDRCTDARRPVRPACWDEYIGEKRDGGGWKRLTGGKTDGRTGMPVCVAAEEDAMHCALWPVSQSVSQSSVGDEGNSGVVAWLTGGVYGRACIEGDRMEKGSYGGAHASKRP
ncbi:hypothetical protein BKA81DRAFT_94635 [Phyllosticta paracitricarpa]